MGSLSLGNTCPMMLLSCLLIGFSLLPGDRGKRIHTHSPLLWLNSVLLTGGAQRQLAAYLLLQNTTVQIYTINWWRGQVDEQMGGRISCPATHSPTKGPQRKERVNLDIMSIIWYKLSKYISRQSRLVHIKEQAIYIYKYT